MNYFIRVALAHDIEIQNFLKTGQHSCNFYPRCILYHADLADLSPIVSGKQFPDWKILSFSADNHNINYNNIHFPNTELGDQWKDHS